jgi:hypothetical protein
MVLPLNVSVPPEIVTFWPMLPVIQIPPAEVEEVRFG